MLNTNINFSLSLYIYIYICMNIIYLLRPSPLQVVPVEEQQLLHGEAVTRQPSHIGRSIVLYDFLSLSLYIYIEREI